MKRFGFKIIVGIDQTVGRLVGRDPEPMADPVVDPLFGYGGSRLLEMTVLESPGEDWVLSADASLLFVSMPFVGKVAVVDTASWDVDAIETSQEACANCSIDLDVVRAWTAEPAGRCTFDDPLDLVLDPPRFLSFMPVKGNAGNGVI